MEGFFLSVLRQLYPEGLAIEKINPDRKFQSRLKFSISIEISIPDLQNSPQKIGDWRVARLNVSIPLEIFNPGRRYSNFSIFGQSHLQ